MAAASMTFDDLAKSDLTLKEWVKLHESGVRDLEGMARGMYWAAVLDTWKRIVEIRELNHMVEL